MVLNYYGLREQPFGATPNYRFLYRSRTHLRALRSLLSPIEAGREFQVLIGDPGTGKTALLYYVLQQFHTSARTAFLFNAQLESHELVNYILRELKIEGRATNVADAQAQIAKTIQEENCKGRKVLVIIDEAHNLEGSLETVAQLFDAARVNGNQVRVVLAGLPQLQDMLARRNLDGFRNRLDAQNYLTGLDASEVDLYIEHLLRLAGYSGDALFTPEAIAAIAAHTKGIPREINNLCFAALRKGAALGRQGIDRSIIEEIFSENQLAWCGAEESGSATEGAHTEHDEQMQIPTSRDRLEGALLAWLKRDASSWCGTAAELMTELNEAINPDELVPFVEDNLEMLRSHGIIAGVWRRAWQPQLISLRCWPETNLQPTSQIPTSEAQETPQPEPQAAADMSVSELTAHRAQVIPTEPPGIVPATTHSVTNAARTQLTTTRSVATYAVLEEPPSATPAELPITSTSPSPELWSLPGFQLAEHEQAGWSRSAMVLAGVAVLVIAVAGMAWHYSRSREVRPKVPVSQPELTGVSHDQVADRVFLSADRGDPAAQYRLGLLYKTGLLVPQNAGEAAAWFQKAAEQGQVDAEYELGMAFLSGEGVSQDNVNAYTWFVVASAAGDRGSDEAIKVLTPKLTDSDIARVRAQLGDMYSRGIGARPDYVAAYTWFTLAEAAGENHSASGKNDLAAKMTPEQISEANARASEWLKKHTR